VRGIPYRSIPSQISATCPKCGQPLTERKLAARVNARASGLVRGGRPGAGIILECDGGHRYGLYIEGVKLLDRVTQ
jgi:hypothetical protein